MVRFSCYNISTQNIMTLRQSNKGYNRLTENWNRIFEVTEIVCRIQDYHG